MTTDDWRIPSAVKHVNVVASDLLAQGLQAQRTVLGGRTGERESSRWLFEKRKKVVRLVGLEPTASAFAGLRSIQLSYKRTIWCRR